MFILNGKIMVNEKVEKARSIIAGMEVNGMRIVFLPNSRRRNEVGLEQAKTILNSKDMLTPEDRWLLWALDTYQSNAM